MGRGELFLSSSGVGGPVSGKSWECWSLFKCFLVRLEVAGLFLRSFWLVLPFPYKFFDALGQSLGLSLGFWGSFFHILPNYESKCGEVAYFNQAKQGG